MSKEEGHRVAHWTKSLSTSAGCLYGDVIPRVRQGSKYSVVEQFHKDLDRRDEFVMK